MFYGDTHFTNVMDLMCKVKHEMGMLQALEARPIPFAYTHLFNTVVHLYLMVVIYAAQFVEGNFWLRLVCFAFLTVILTAFTALASSMAKPIGRGPMKIDVIAMCLNRYRQAMEFADE